MTWPPRPGDPRLGIALGSHPLRIGRLCAELIRPADPRWMTMVATEPHDFYHLPAYAQLSARYEGGMAGALLVTDGTAQVLVPLVVRPLEGKLWDAASPYGYPGPIVCGTQDASFVDEAMEIGGLLLADQGVVSLFVRFHPLLNSVLPSGPGLVRHGDTVVVDLDLPDDEAWHLTRSNHRTHISRAMHMGDIVAFDNSPEAFEGFRTLYRETMIRLGASPFYFFDEAYFSDLREALGARMRLATVRVGGDLAAACLITEVGDIVQYHLAGTGARHADHHPSKLIIHFVRGWAKERGDKWFHLGGGRGGAHDTLLHFKEGFSPEHRPFHTFRMVVDQREYGRLCRETGQELDPAVLTDFFPLYRKH